MCFSSSCGPKCTARFLVRVGFGLSLIFTGVANERDPVGFAQSVGQDLGYTWLMSLGVMWGYVLPIMFIVGGLCLTFNIFKKFAIWCVGLALVSIPAGLMLKSAASGISLGDTMPPAMNALIWILVFLIAVKGTKSCGMGACGGACCVDTDAKCPMCGMNPCMCGMQKKSAPSVAKKPAPKKSAKKSM
jgi:hypothetical protein